MVETTDIIVSIINLIALVLGGIAIGLIFKLSRVLDTVYLRFFLYFLVFAVVSGFCDWIIFNWVDLLIPGMPMDTTDSIYHIFWDLIGFPSTVIALYFLIRSLNSLIKIHEQAKGYILILVLIIAIALSFLSFYYHLQNTSNILTKVVWVIYTFGLPLITTAYLFYSLIRSRDKKAQQFDPTVFISLLLVFFLIWYAISYLSIPLFWKQLIIFAYYIALLIPAIYLFLTLPKQFGQGGELLAENRNPVFEEYDFTEREKELATLLIEGKSNQEIAEEMFISLQTVKNYISKMYRKVGLKNRVQFVNFVKN